MAGAFQRGVFQWNVFQLFTAGVRELTALVRFGGVTCACRYGGLTCTAKYGGVTSEVTQ